MSIPIPEPLMREAYNRRRGPGWPDTFELTMMSPFYSRLVRLEALHGETSRIEGFKASDRSRPTTGVILSVTRNGANQNSFAKPTETIRYWWHDRD